MKKMKTITVTHESDRYGDAVVGIRVTRVDNEAVVHVTFTNRETSIYRACVPREDIVNLRDTLDEVLESWK